LILQGFASLNGWRNLCFEEAATVALMFGSGVCLLAGVMTPFVSLLVVVGGLAYALKWAPATTASFFNSKLAILYLTAMAAAIVFLGPGAFSFDARLFGRREIKIPSLVNPKNDDV
jgi:uncharacterized membrane protein YphA (DoxX/SURF4 family)